MHRNPVFCKLLRDACRQDEERHALCPHYDQCLDDAIRRNQNFSCRACEFKKRGIRAYKVHDGIED